MTALEAVVRRQEALLAEVHRRLTVPLPPPPTEGLLDIARLPLAGQGGMPMFKSAEARISVGSAGSLPGPWRLASTPSVS